MLGDPLAKSNGNIERIKTKGNKAQKHPQNDATPKLKSIAVKYESVTVNIGVALLPLQKSASAKRNSDTKSDYRQKHVQKISADVTPKTTCEFRFHNKNLLSKYFLRGCVHFILAYTRHAVKRFGIFFPILFECFCYNLRTKDSLPCKACGNK